MFTLVIRSFETSAGNKPILEHRFYGDTADVAFSRYQAHRKSDQFLRDCEESGLFNGSIPCHNEAFWLGANGQMEPLRMLSSTPSASPTGTYGSNGTYGGNYTGAGYSGNLNGNYGANFGGNYTGGGYSGNYSGNYSGSSGIVIGGNVRGGGR